MSKIVQCLVVAVLLTAAPAFAGPKVVMQTSKGEIVLELNEEKAPITVKNFLKYVDDGFYQETIFHRVIPGFMIQGGGFDAERHKKETRPPIKNEADNGLKNDRGTIAMARTREVASATAQFFINLVDNDFLNHKDNSPRGYGYAVFGKVVEGMEVVDKIAAMPTRNSGGPFQNLPVETVVIRKVERMNGSGQ